MKSRCHRKYNFWVTKKYVIHDKRSIKNQSDHKTPSKDLPDRYVSAVKKNQ
jgi:hypothetical protein